MAKRIISDDTTDMLDQLLGEPVAVWCLNYIYAGTLNALDDKTLELTDAYVVYETGPLNTAGFTNAQSVPNPIFINRSTIESITRQV